MLAIRTRYDGKEIHVPRNARGLPPCNVIVLFEQEEPSESAEWVKMQEKSLMKAWDDKEDAIYDDV